MKTHSRTFTNELGNQVTAAVAIDGDEVTMTLEGPSSVAESVITRTEAGALAILLIGALLDS